MPMTLEWWHLLVLTIAAAVSVIAIRLVFNVHFDVNKWQETRREHQKIKLRNLCTHVSIEKQGDRYLVNSLFVSPVGTMQYVCDRCGLITSPYNAKRLQDRWAGTMDLKQYILEEQKFSEMAKKMGLV